ncbi:MAG: hypothetical protein KOO66_13095 [Bacteroidales bacterium]|nr:hypothetical protein [Bacteroidales bacterium]
MKNRKKMWVILPFIITFSLYLVFYSETDSKPTDAGFWFILAMGISIGVILTRLLKK